MIVSQAQRWRERRDTWVPARSTINPAELAVDVIEEPAARAFVVQHHYSGTFPAARLSVGLFRRAHLVGVAVFSEGQQRRALPCWAGVPADRGCELGRLVLLDDVAFNGESWFLARAFGLLAREKRLDAVLSYSDPLPRLNAMRQVVKPGHVGQVYQALGAVYRGLSGERTAYATPDGEQVSGRALSKIRLEERGADYAAEQLLTLGAHARARGEGGREWLLRLSAEGWLRRFRHPGNHAYVFPISGQGRARARALETRPYPRLSV